MAEASVDEESSRKVAADEAAPNYKDDEEQGGAPVIAAPADNNNNKRFTVNGKFYLPGFRNPTHGIVEFANGKKYYWNSRQHRKLRHIREVVSNTSREEKKSGRTRRRHCYHTRFLSFEPHIVTWWNVWIGFVANTLWIINGAFCVLQTGPFYDVAASLNVSFATGIVGAFLFIVTAYLSIVEVINHAHHAIVEPSEEKKNINRKKGKMWSRLSKHVHPFDQQHNNSTGEEEEEETYKKVEKDGDTQTTSPHRYSWWTWHPNILDHISIFSSYLFWVCTILFFIPACLQESTLPFGIDIFFNYTLQIIPSVGFILCGYCTMIESTGSYNPFPLTFVVNKNRAQPYHYQIGYWIGFFNLLGGIGFLLCPILFLPGYVCGNNNSGPNNNCSVNFDALDTWGGCFSTFLGSIFFWIAGVLACIEFASVSPSSMVR